MLLATTSIKRPVLATVINALLLVVGAAALARLPVRQFPDIDPPVISITTTYLGASAGVVENDVTKRVEEAIAGIEGIRLINSTSRDEASQIDVEFALGRDIDFAAADVRDQIGRIRKQLPPTVDEPILAKASASSNPMMWLSLSSGTRDQLALTDFARRNLVDAFSVVPGVARVFVGGERRYAMRIWLDRQLLAARDLSPNEVVARLEAENVELPAGRIESERREMTVRTTTRLATVDDFRALVVADRPGGQVRLGDVARVELGAENERTALLVDGKPAVGLAVVRQSTANALDVANGVRAAMERLRPGLPKDIDFTLPYDQSVFITASLREVMITLAIALALVVVVILAFLGSFRATLIPAAAIPVSLIAAGTVMYLLGYSINVLTLLAMVLAIGLVVDDAIVVLENIWRRLENGEPRLLAAINGTREVGFAVIATTTVLVAVFVPVAFQAGTVGRLFSEFGITLAATVAFSGFVALTLAPMLASLILPRHAGASRIARTVNKVFDVVVRLYAWALALCLRARGLVLAVALAVIGIGAWIMATLPKELAPTEDQGFLFVVIETPQGSTLEYTQERVKQAEALFTPYMGEGRDKPVARVLSIVAPAFTAGAPVNSAFIFVNLKPWDERDMSQQELSGPLRLRGFGLSGMFCYVADPPSLGLRNFGQKPVQYVLGGDSYDEAQVWSRMLQERVRGERRLADLRDDVETTRPQLQVSIDKDRAADLGLSVRDIGEALQIMFGARKATRFEERAEEYEVMVQAELADRRVPLDIAGLQVRSAKTGKLVPLDSVVSWREVGTAKQLTRIDRRPSVTISAKPEGWSLGEALDYFDAAAAQTLPATARVSYLGESREYKESTGGTLLIFGAAVLIVFLVLAAQFESWIHPGIIIVSAPLAFAGAVLGLLAMGLGWTIYAQVGTVMLVGLMAKNGILVVEFANQLRDRGRDVHAAITEASALRLRPILMTSIATVAGAVPLAVAHGAGAEGRQAIGTVIVGGVTVATVLTLFVIPVLYSLLARYTKPAGAIAAEVERLEGAQVEKSRG